MLSGWFDLFVSVCRFWWNAMGEAFWKSLAFFGQTREGIISATFLAMVFIAYLLIRYGWAGMQTKVWEKVLEGVAVAMAAFLLILILKLFTEPYSELSGELR
jgi:hypothetical protein